jgi:Protein of unknown function (DUF1559)
MSFGSPNSPYAPGPLQPAPQQGMSVWIILLIVFAVIFVLMLLCGGLGLALMLPAVQQARTAARMTVSQNNLNQIGIAILNYESTYRSLPPAYVSDEQGKPLYSWRVVILPYFGEGALYNEFHLDEPWDSPHNILLLNRMPAIYRSPTEPNLLPTNSSYVAPVDPKAAVNVPPNKITKIIDGLSNTSLVFEVANSTTPWSAPDSMTTDQIIQANAGRTKPVLMGDAAVSNMDFSNPANIKAGVTIDGGEVFNGQ